MDQTVGRKALTFTESVKTCFKKYIDFSGRASRSEYWWFFLFTFVVRLVVTWIPIIGFVISLALLLPSLAATARRLHDTNRTGWWMLLPIGLGIAGIVAGAVLAVVGLFFLGVALGFLGSIGGFLALLVFLIQPGDPHPNHYGPDPLQPRYDMGGFDYTRQGRAYDSSPYETDFTAPNYDYEPLPTSELTESEQRRYCTQCGMQLAAEARFCNTCGTPVQQS